MPYSVPQATQTFNKSDESMVVPKRRNVLHDHCSRCDCPHKITDPLNKAISWIIFLSVLSTERRKRLTRYARRQDVKLTRFYSNYLQEMLGGKICKVVGEELHFWMVSRVGSTRLGINVNSSQDPDASGLVASRHASRT
jgi:hypothetical protein